MKAKDMIIKLMRRAKEERGLRVSKPSSYLSEGHIRKADHNLIVMTDLSKLRHEDWIVISAYYAMYQSAMSLLTKIGLESKDHATTAAVLEYLFGEYVSRDLIGKFNELKERKDNGNFDVPMNFKRNHKAAEMRPDPGSAREVLTALAFDQGDHGMSRLAERSPFEQCLNHAAGRSAGCQFARKCLGFV